MATRFITRAVNEKYHSPALRDYSIVVGSLGSFLTTLAGTWLKKQRVQAGVCRRNTTARIGRSASRAVVDGVLWIVYVQRLADRHHGSDLRVLKFDSGDGRFDVGFLFHSMDTGQKSWQIFYTISILKGAGSPSNLRRS